MPNKLSQFWQELKRRKVLKVIAMYAGGAIVLIELANNVVVPLNLPDWTPRFVIIIALVGFPIMVVLSWIFDFTPEGLSKTDSIEELKEQEAPPSPVRRRLKVSDVIIGILVIVVGILVYPRFFGTARLNAMTFPVTVVNEFGERETRRVVKEKYITKLALFPFIDESNDSSLSWMAFGIMDAIREDNIQFPNMLIEWDGAALLNEQITHARNMKYPYFLTGTYHVTEGHYTITSKLYQASNGSLKQERTFMGDDFFSLIDSLTVQARMDLSITDVILNSTPDLSISELMTNNLEAYANYIEGRYYWHYSDKLYAPLYKAIEMDSTFALASYWMAYWNYNYQKSHASAVSYINQAMRHRGRLSENSDIDTRILYHLIRGDAERVVELTEYQIDLSPYDFKLMLDVQKIYWRLNLLDLVEHIVLRMNELVPNNPSYQILLADSYLFSGKPDKGQDVLNILLKDNPEHVEALLKIFEIYLHQKELDAAEEVLRKAILLMPEEEEHWSKLRDHITYMREKKNLKTVLESFTGTYRNELKMRTAINSIANNQLTYKPQNQASLFYYPVSDTVVVCAFKNADEFDFAQVTFIRNKQKKIIKKFDEQWGSSSYAKSINWIEDSLILVAKDLLESGRASEALSAFRSAFDQHPEHYYLANFIQHLEFVQSPEYESLKSAFNDMSGKYGDVNFHIEGDQFYYTNNEGLIYKLLPLVADRFMTASIYALEIHMSREGGEVTGMKFVYRDGREEFYPRTTKSTRASQNQ